MVVKYISGTNLMKIKGSDTIKMPLPRSQMLYCFLVSLNQFHGLGNITANAKLGEVVAGSEVSGASPLCSVFTSTLTAFRDSLYKPAIDVDHVDLYIGIRSDLVAEAN